MNDSIKLVEIESEQRKYASTMTIEEMRRLTLQNDKECGRNPLTLDEINEYIREVRYGN